MSAAKSGLAPFATSAQQGSKSASSPPPIALARATWGIAFALCRALQGLGQFAAHAAEIAFDPAFSSDQDVVMIGQAGTGQCFAQQFAKAPLHPVANHRITDLLRYRDAVTHAPALTDTFIANAIGVGKQHKSRPRDAQPAIGGKKISAPGKNRNSHKATSRNENGRRLADRKGEAPSHMFPSITRELRQTGPRRGTGPRESGAEFLATATTAIAQNLAATHGCLAGEETVAAGTHEITRLKSAFHRN